MSEVVNIYPLRRYTYGEKERKKVKYSSIAERLARIRDIYNSEGRLTTVEGILLGQQHNHPYVLLLKTGNTSFRLPGGRLQPGENDIDGLKRKLYSKLGAKAPNFQQNWKVGERVAVWWRPNFGKRVYPYCPPHITRPRECKKLYIVHLPERDHFDVPKNLKLLAVPFFDLYDNVQKYGHAISCLPELLSRFDFNMINP